MCIPKKKMDQHKVSGERSKLRNGCVTFLADIRWPKRNNWLQEILLDSNTKTKTKY